MSAVHGEVQRILKGCGACVSLSHGTSRQACPCRKIGRPQTENEAQSPEAEKFQTKPQGSKYSHVEYPKPFGLLKMACMRPTHIPKP